MPSGRYIAVGALAVAAGITAALAVAPLRPSALQPREPGSAPVHVFGGRSAAQASSPAGAKFDAALASIARHRFNVRADHALSDLRAMNPGMRFMQQDGASEPLVLIDAVTGGDAEQLKGLLENLGLQHAALFSNDVSGWLPVSQLDVATQQSEVQTIRAAMPKTRSGSITTQGDFVLHADAVRSQNSLDGSGVTVGILSDSYNCYAAYAAAGSGVPASGPAGYASNGFTATAPTDISSGDLPASANIQILKEAPCFGFNKTLQLPLGDEGRAMMQIVHDVAPGAKLAFYSAEYGEAAFAAGIQALANGGAKVIADDVGYFDEPFFQDGIVAEAINSVAASGVTYFSAAGNNGDTAYDNLTPTFAAAATSGPNSGEKLLNSQGSTTTLPLMLPAMSPGDFVGIVVEWDQPFITGAAASGGSQSRIDVCVQNAGTETIIDDDGNRLSTGCTGLSALGADPVQVLLIGNPASATSNSSPVNVNLLVGLAATGSVTPSRIKLVVEGNGLNLGFTPTGATLQGHPNAAGAAAVGAAFYFDTPACGAATPSLEPFSSKGGDPLLFNADGTRISGPVTPRAKPDFVGPDGGNDTFLGFKTSQNTTGNLAACTSSASYPNFFGTSAATPHLAAVAALLLQANAAVTPAQMIQYMRQSALPMSEGPSFVGAGFVQADTTATFVPAVAPAAPTLSLASSSILVGATTTITWSSANTTGCTAAGGWSGALASSGSQTLSGTAAGSITYTLQCANAAGSSPTSSVTLAVTAAAPPAASSHGGGELDLWSLLGLGLVGVLRARKTLKSLH